MPLFISFGSFIGMHNFCLSMENMQSTQLTMCSVRMMMTPTTTMMVCVVMVIHKYGMNGCVVVRYENECDAVRVSVMDVFVESKLFETLISITLLS